MLAVTKCPYAHGIGAFIYPCILENTLTICMIF